MPHPRENRALLHARDERSRKALRHHRHHSPGPPLGRRPAGRAASPLPAARPGRDFRQRGGIMSLRNIGVVYRKELIDSLRDRRTVVSMIAVPILLMPLLTVGLGVLSVVLWGRAMQEIPEVMVLGGQDSPGVGAALQALGEIRVFPPSPTMPPKFQTSRFAPPSRFPAILMPPSSAERFPPCAFTCTRANCAPASGPAACKHSSAASASAPCASVWRRASSPRACSSRFASRSRTWL